MSNSGGQRTQSQQPNMIPLSTSVRLSKWLGTKLFLTSKVDSAKRRIIKRGDVYWCEFRENIGSEQCQKRPALVLQNNNANHSSPNTIVVPITNTADSNSSVYPLKRPHSSNLKGHVLLGNIVTVSKARLGDYIDKIDVNTELPGIEKALYNAVGVAPKIAKLEKQLQRTTDHLDRVKEDRNIAQDTLKEICNILGLSGKSEYETILEEITRLRK